MTEKLEIRGVGKPSDDLMTISNPEGERFLVFDRAIFPHLEIGKIVELEVKRDIAKKSGDGTYNAIQSITVDGKVIGGKKRGGYTPRGRDEDRTDHRSALITIKDLWLGGKLKDDNYLVTWLLAELLVIATDKKESKSETTKTHKGGQETQTELIDKPDSGEATDEERVSGFFKYLEKHDIKDVKLWLNVEYGIDPAGTLTPKKCEALYKAIKKDKGW